MHKTCLIELIMILIKLIIAEYKDHIIYWDASNSIFEENPDELYVNEGDNLIFICSTNRTHVRNLYWRKRFIVSDFLRYNPFLFIKNNIRLSFKLAKNSVNDKNNSLVSDVLMFPISKSQLFDQNKCKLN
ncbi:hypothetical protein Smp_133090 [Schistosoma mansoni]|uniref:hypothetical protein n=1 Tax=Schistosoma mansoni TaxID=6183 RepID=UPI00022DC5C9|nr:hypothetical protein Smp_133090 [Schistosoma mansoni]|eukprot:XP_018647970.1 hypothetical protein Smp_133090 [Schistosoma mansoni]